MFKRKNSIFNRLTGGLRLDEESFEDELQDFEDIEPEESVRLNPREERTSSQTVPWMEEEDSAAELSIDVYDNGKEIIVQTMVAGVKPEDINIDIKRDTVTIEGSRKESKTMTDEDYGVRELYWGSFSRTVNLPDEIDPDMAEATEKHGLLIVRLPKIDKNKQKKVKIKSI